MKQHMRAHPPRRKPFTEAHQTQITVAGFVLLVATLIYVFGYVFPADPPAQSQQPTVKIKRSSP